MDPFTLLMVAQSTVAAIKRGCELLSEGKAEISNLKATVEKGVGDAKAIFNEVTGFWGWLKGLFANEPKSPTVSPKPATEPEVASARPPQAVSAASKKKVKQAELTYEEYKARMIHDQVENLKVLFQTLRQLREEAEKLKEESTTADDIEGSALSRVEIELGIEDMLVQVRNAMVYAPVELKDIYSRFLKMYDLILEEREFDRQVKLKQERDRKAYLWLLRRQAISEITALSGVLLLALILWLTWMPLITRRGFL